MTAPMVPGYRDLELLGQGGFGAVYAAVHESTGRRVALKVILASRSGTHKDRVRFRREARVLARIRHPSIVRLFDFGELEDGSLYLTMGLVGGGSLEGVLEAAPHPWEEAVRLLLPITRALAHAHAQGVVHRDVKPGNILLDEDGRPHLADFGLALALEENVTRVTRVGSVVGTLPYLSPEALVFQEMSPAGDVYALGVLLHALVTGAPPFGWPDTRTVLLERARRDAPPLPESAGPPWFRALVAAALARHAGRRITAGDLARRLEEQEAPEAPQPANPEEEERWADGEGPPADAPTLVDLSVADTVDLGEDAGATRVTEPPQEARPSAGPGRAGVVLAGALLVGALVAGLASLSRAPPPGPPEVHVEHAPHGSRVHVSAAGARSVWVDGHALEHDPVRGAWISDWLSLPAAGRRSELRIEGGGGTRRIAVELSGGWTPEVELPDTAYELAGIVRPVPFRPGARLRAPAWILDAAVSEAPPALVRAEPREVRLVASSRVAEGERLLLVVQLHGRSSPHGIQARLGGGEPWPLGPDAASEVPEQEQPLLVLGLPRGTGTSAPAEVTLSLPDHATPRPTLRGAWLLATGDEAPAHPVTGVLVARLEAQVAALDLAITGHWPQDDFGFVMLAEAVGTGRRARVRRMVEGGWSQQAPWPSWIAALEESARRLGNRLRDAPDSHHPGRVLAHLLDLVRTRRVLGAVEPLLAEVLRRPSLRAPYGEPLEALLGVAWGEARGDPSEVAQRFRDAARDLRRRLPASLAPWVDFLTARLRLDMAARDASPGALEEAFVEAARRAAALPEARGVSVSGILRELLGIAARTRDPRSAGRAVLATREAIAAAQGLVERLDTLPASRERDLDRALGRLLMEELRQQLPEAP